MAAPAAVGMLITFLFQLVDTYFVGKLGTQELAAVSFSFPVYFLFISLFLGIASGVSSTVGKALGEQNVGKVQSVTFISLFLMIVISQILGIAGYYSIDPVFSLLGATETLLPLIKTYMEPLFLGMSALAGTLVGNAAMMAKGRMGLSTVVMGIGGLVNLVLDYALIFGLGPIEPMALKGAAFATVISWLVTLGLMSLLLAKERLLSWTAIGSFDQMVKDTREIFSIGIPSVAAQIFNPIAIGVLTRTVASFGTGAVAAYGIATRIETLALTGILSLSVILTPVVAQNFGAHKKHRLDQVIAYSGRLTVYWGFMVYLILIVTSGFIAPLFSSDPEVIKHTQLYFYLVGFSFAGYGLTLITTSFFNGVYEPKLSLKLTLIKSLGFMIPFAIIGSFISLEAIWIGIALANISGAVYSGKLLNKWLAANGSSLVGHNPLNDYLSDFKAIIRSRYKKSDKSYKEDHE